MKPAPINQVSALIHSLNASGDQIVKEFHLPSGIALKIDAGDSARDNNRKDRVTMPEYTDIKIACRQPAYVQRHWERKSQHNPCEENSVQPASSFPKTPHRRLIAPSKTAIDHPDGRLLSGLNRAACWRVDFFQIVSVPVGCKNIDMTGKR